MIRKLGWTAVGLATAALASCNAVIGNEDRVLRHDAGSPTPIDGGDRVDGAVVNPCAADLANDRKNCGTCGHDCLEGACASSKCQPTTIVKTFQAEQVAVVGNILYYTHNEAAGAGVSWCLLDDCSAPRRFFENTGAYGLAADEAGVVVASPVQGLVYTYPPRYDGSTGPAILASIPSPIGVTIDASNVFFTTAAGSLYRCPRAGCAGGPVLVAKGTAPGGAVAVGTSRAVWASARSADSGVTDGFLQQVDKKAVDAGAIVASFGRGPRTLVMTGTRLVWTATDGPQGYNGEVSLRPNALDDNEMICQSGLGDPWGVAVDETHVYFTLPTAGEVRRFPIGSCVGKAVETIATGQGKPHGITVDATHVYWANFNGAIVRLAK